MKMIHWFNVNTYFIYRQINSLMRYNKKVPDYYYLFITKYKYLYPKIYKTIGSFLSILEKYHYYGYVLLRKTRLCAKAAIDIYILLRIRTKQRDQFIAEYDKKFGKAKHWKKIKKIILLIRALDE